MLHIARVVYSINYVTRSMSHYLWSQAINVLHNRRFNTEDNLQTSVF